MKKLAIAILHYHLRPGGVTRVIERAVESLGDRVDLLVLTGEAPAPTDLLTPLTEPFGALEYADNAINEHTKVAEDLRFTARCLLGRDPDIWHIHNHSLGKNSFVPLLVRHLAEAGCRLLLQPHDFAEDGRPENYRLLRDQLGDDLGQTLYPTSNHIWYAPINQRDKTFLENIGITHVHSLPNAVTVPQASLPATGRNDQTIVYPARAIRRKNIGEFLLWSLLSPEGYRFISTLAPQNPKAKPIYEQWVEFAQKLNLPVEFDAGRATPFSELVNGAAALITTSIAEGFGLAFLEPWLAGKPLVGRNILEITADFYKEGLDLSTLYSALPVPLEWIGRDAFQQELATAMRASYAAYSRDWDDQLVEQAMEALLQNGTVDFGLLSETLQRKVLQHLADKPEDRALLPTLNLAINPEQIEQNRSVVESRYGLAAYGDRLFSLYRQLADIEPGTVEYSAPATLLDQFLRPERFHLLRT